MSDPPSRARRWVAIALVVTSLLILGGVIGVPWVLRNELIANQASCCDVAAEFHRERPGAAEGGPEEVGRCLRAVVDGLPSSIREGIEPALVEHGRTPRGPADPLGPLLLDVPMSDETLAAIDRCAAARSSRFLSGDGLAVKGVLERYTREAHLERDADERLRRLVVALELWIDVYVAFDQSIVGPLLWAREIGQSGPEAGPDVRREAAERLRALAASLPDVETATAIFYCANYAEVQTLSIADAWEANEQFGTSLAMAASAEPASWGREPAENRLERAIPSGIQHEQYVAPGSAYVAGTLMLAAQQLHSTDEAFLGQQPRPIEVDSPMNMLPCSELTLPSALDHREISLCSLDPDGAFAGRELNRLYRALRATALEDPSRVPERIDDLEARPADGSGASELVPAEAPCVPAPRPAEAMEAWASVGYTPPRDRRVAISLLHPRLAPPGPTPDHVEGWRLLRARWRVGRVPNLREPSVVICDGPVREARLWVGPGDDPRAGQLQLGEVSEPAAESR